MHLQVVHTKKQIAAWHSFAITLYVNDANYIQPLYKDVEKFFDAKQNKLLTTTNCERWLIYYEDKIVARIAVFVNPNYKQTIPVGCFGFFESIDDVIVANFTLEKAKQWLLAKGMHAMDGPVNFGERDMWWGCLVDGFYPPLYGLTYNKTYYKNLLENFGCGIYYNQLCYTINNSTLIPPKYYLLANTIRQRYGLEIKQITKNNLVPFAIDFATIYNQAFAQHGEGKAITKEQAIATFKSMQQVLDPTINWFVYHHGQPIGMFLNLPDLNFYFKTFKGKWGLLQKIQLLLKIKTNPTNKMVGIVMGIVPMWQGKGVDALMFAACKKVLDTSGKYNELEMQWLGDFNTKMINMANRMGAEQYRKLITYRYMFDGSIPNRKSPI